MPAPQPSARLLPLDGGSVELDPRSGAPLQFVDAASPARRFLLDHDQDWHSVDHRWGSGWVITDDGAHAWNEPHDVRWTAAGPTAVHAPGGGLELLVERSADARLHERYRWRNVGDRVVTITGIAVQTPFADIYPSARSALERAVHAHVFTGGSWSWVLAQPMDGAGRCLGLIVTDGALHGYSIESRNQWTNSNVRGHIVLHPTDRARNPTAFGEQPSITLRPGDEYRLGWTVGFYEDVDGFLAATAAPVRLDRVSAPVGTAITVTGAAATVTSAPGVVIERIGDAVAVRADTPGTYPLRIGDARTEIQFFPPLEETVRARCRWIAEHQVARHRPGLLRHALVPVDVRTKVQSARGGWDDWSDGSERIGMAVLLQQSVRLGWAGDDVAALVEGWAEFARALLLTEDGAPHRDAQAPQAPPRLYDSPWSARFFLDRYRLTGERRHLELAATLVERFYELGSGRFLAIGLSEVCADLAADLRGAGDPARAAAVDARVVASAHHFVAAGTDLLGHEVNYEQSLVAPLVALLSDAYAISADPVLLEAVRARLPWLLAFGGPQPHHRLQDIPIRHWDGYWFGVERMWGDVFPHYWSVLTASALLRLPDALRTEEHGRIAQRILESGMSSFFADGSATCAFVMPSTVDGRPAHLADPLANDQDWHLSIWLRLLEDRA